MSRVLAVGVVLSWLVACGPSPVAPPPEGPKPPAQRYTFIADEVSEADVRLVGTVLPDATVEVKVLASRPVQGVAFRLVYDGAVVSFLDASAGTGWSQTPRVIARETETGLLVAYVGADGT